jgi:hypothetical protein
MEPLRSWKEIFLGERALKNKKSCRPARRFGHGLRVMRADHVAVGE